MFANGTTTVTFIIGKKLGIRREWRRKSACEFCDQSEEIEHSAGVSSRLFTVLLCSEFGLGRRSDASHLAIRTYDLEDAGRNF